jgi:predicted ABC-class ATPase
MSTKEVKQIKKQIMMKLSTSGKVPLKLYKDLTRATVDEVKSELDLAKELNDVVVILEDFKKRKLAEHKKEYLKQYYQTTLKDKRKEEREAKPKRPTQVKLKCQGCGATITGRSKAKKFCDECAKKRRQDKIQAWREQHPELCKEYSRKSNKKRAKKSQP